ncbi:hypothetical protein Pyrfu_1240 [Pyrolobus fumarii 1A]|uniref:Uncharacterized protein n=1 Tax=Pyrolobus fumarii (strain DSM 11204 / 1A) TaxID=694429 RepID=G0EFZ8_PYRF1|nr:hypothetical protein [Pyrolobus fumarii]AEM39099.1 hypothetical protein Pyrfu_1240 [Pyrolobus fumarii 1A]
MARYNPYFFQTLDAPYLRTNVDTTLALLGGFTIHATGIEVLAVPSGCERYASLVEGALKAGTWGRDAVESLLLLMLKGELSTKLGKSARFIVELSCEDLDDKLRRSIRVYPPMVNDLRRGYVIRLENDDEACSEWEKNNKALLTELAESIASVVRAYGMQLDAVTVGSIIFLLGTLLRVTPAYHLLAIAVGIASTVSADVCTAGTLRYMQEHLRGSRIAGKLAPLIPVKTGDPRGRVAELLTAELRLLCRAVEQVRSTQSALNALREAAKRIGMTAELLDPSLYTLDVRVLGVAPNEIDEEVEACIARCEPTR